MNRVYTLALTIALGVSFTSLSAQQLKGDDPSLSFEQRAENLVAQMTFEEKIGQMVNQADAIPRLGLPAYNWWNECLHGLARAGKATVFPQAIGLAATFDPDLIERMTGAIADEARVFYDEAMKRGNNWFYTGLTFYSPNVNIFRDPRWGRGQETYGEDPYLTSRIGVSFVNGLQGGDSKYLKTAACAKHYAVHSGPERDRHWFDAQVGERDLYETYLPAFKALVQEANVKSVMGAYNRTNGEACCASPTLLVDILREDWGFDGYLTTDCGAIVDIFAHHKLAADGAEAAAMAIKTTMNLNCGSVYKNDLQAALDRGLVEESEIDDLLCQLMVTRFELGLFDDPEQLPFSDIDINVVDSKLHKDLAYETALKSMVLLENKNGALPLDNDKMKYLFVTGPNANNSDALIGNYFGTSGDMTTFLEGLAAKIPVGASIQYRQGVALDTQSRNAIDWASGEGASADAVVVCMGLTWLLEGEEGESILSTQSGDLYDNEIPAAQIEYLRKVKSHLKSGQPLIVVMSGGCPVQLNQIRELADAIIYAWYPGEAGGSALADIIMGDANPSGRSPMTFVQSIDDLPPFEEYAMEGRTYRYMRDKEPLYPFGHGLSYSTFDYSDLSLKSTIKAGEELEVSVTIKNSSSRAGDEVVQLYITDNEASVPVPVRQLAAFTRVSLGAGESETVTLKVNPDKMSLITDDVKRKIEAGEFTISVGGGQPLPSTHSYVTSTFKVRGNAYLEL